MNRFEQLPFELLVSTLELKSTLHPSAIVIFLKHKPGHFPFCFGLKFDLSLWKMSLTLESIFYSLLDNVEGS